MFLALFIIVYGQFQAATPKFVLRPLRQGPPNKLVEVLWGMVNCVPTAVLGGIVAFHDAFKDGERPEMLATVIVGIAVFALVFAVNSAIHSYLVVRYAEGDKVSTSIGYYYMSNAMGRLMGTLVSGALYSYAGEDSHGVLRVNRSIGWCFFAGTACSVMAVLLTLKIRDQRSGLRCGPCLQCIQGSGEEVEDMAGVGEE